MGGLDEIISQIKSDAQAEVDNIMADVNKQCDSIREESEIQNAKIAKAENKKSEQASLLEFEKIKSNAEMKMKRELLNAKQRIIANIIDKAYKKIISLPDEEYFEIMLQIAKIYVQPGNGVVRFSSFDLKRIPADFNSKLNEIAKSAGGNLQVSGEAVDINGGMILDYGDIEENCTIKALFNNKKEKIQDNINKLIFQ